MLLAAGHTAAGDASAVIAAFTHIDPTNHTKAYELTLLQSLPIIGIPRVLHAAAALQTIGIVGGPTRNQTITPTETQQRGTETFDIIYGRNAARVRHRLGNFSDGLERWIIQSVYGDLFSSTITSHIEITLRERELCLVAALCADKHANVQLASHLRGARNAGATREEVEAVVGMAGVLFGAERGDGAQAVWQSYERARYAL